MFTFARRSSNVYSFIINVVRRSFKKSFTQFNNKVSTFLFRMLCSSRACETLSNVFDTFKLNRDVTFFFELFQIVWIFFVINCSVVSTNLCFLILICVFDNVACVSTTYRMRFDIIDFNVLLSVFNSAIDLTWRREVTSSSDTCWRDRSNKLHLWTNDEDAASA